MSRPRSSRQQPPLEIAGRLAPPSRTRLPFWKAELGAELTRQRALLLAGSKSSFTTDATFEACPDPTDQASVDLEHRLVMLVKIRTIAKLRRIERALQLIPTSDYGQFRRCREDIPYERLKVQPDALLCVPVFPLPKKKGCVIKSPRLCFHSAPALRGQLRTSHAPGSGRLVPSCAEKGQAPPGSTSNDNLSLPTGLPTRCRIASPRRTSSHVTA